MSLLKIKCRVCWVEKPKALQVAVNTSLEGAPLKTIKEIIEFCVPTVTIQLDSFICHECLIQLKLVYDFIDLCLQTESKVLQEILEKSVEDGMKIQIVFEELKPAYEASDHDYYSPLVKHEIKQQDSPPSNFTDNALRKEPQLEDSDNDADNWFTEPTLEEPEPKKKVPIRPRQKQVRVRKIPQENTPEYPEELMNIFDLASTNLRCISIPIEMSQEHREGLEQSGVNIIDLSKDPSKKKRVVYLTRNYLTGRHECKRCNIEFHSRNDYEDHKRLHLKGKIKLPNASITCVFCKGMFNKEGEYAYHCKIVHKRKCYYECSKCNKKIRCPKEYKEHIEMFKDKDKCVFNCDKCNKIFQFKSTYDKHMAGGPSCTYETCTVCSEKFTKQDFVAHSKIHPNYLCPECGRGFHKSANLHVHLGNKHSKTIYMCHECGKILKNGQMLKNHIKNVHATQPKARCEICSREFKNARYLRKHIIMTHESDPLKGHICEQCGKGFSNQHYLKMHQKIVHEQIKKYFCTICSDGFTRNDYLKRHMLVHTYEHICNICRRSFPLKELLLRHENIGHDENGKSLDKSKRRLTTMPAPANLVCNICNKVMANRHILRLHYKAHLQIREFKCDKCELILTTKSNYQRHVKLHALNKISCNICYAHLSSATELQLHLRTKHVNLKYECRYGCGAKFGRKHLQFSHETLKHPEEYIERDKMFNNLLNETMGPVGGRGVKRRRRGAVLEVSGSPTNNCPDDAQEYEEIEENKFNILGTEYQMDANMEQEKACIILQQDMDGYQTT